MTATATPRDNGHKHEAYQAIRRQMITGGLKPGSRISELALSRELGVSRTPVREAIGQLVSEGLAERVRHTGAFVKKPTRADLEDVFELREWHEAGVVVAAARRITPEQVLQLEKAVQDLRVIADEIRRSDKQHADSSCVYRAAVAEITFHMTLMQASGNRRVTRVAGDNYILSHIWTSWPEQNHLRAIASDYRDHARILRYVRRGDAERARQCMIEHIRQGRRGALEVYDLQQRRLEMGDQSAMEQQADLASLESLLEDIKAGDNREC